MTNPCSCSKTAILVFACSGAADVGEISDRAARRVSRTTPAKMHCLAGVGGRVPPILQTVHAAGEILAIDGCPLDCVAETLRNAGFCDFTHVRVTDEGLEKGKTDPEDENNVMKVVNRVTALVGEG